MRIAIVIPVHNRKAFTQACLNSLYHQTIQADYIIVIDDGSTDGTDRMIQEYFPAVVLLTGDGNLFWTAAINKGIRCALSLPVDYILTLNNDTVASENFIENMMMEAKPDILLGALDIDMTTNKSYYGGEIFNWRNGHSKYLLDELTIDQQTGLHEVSLFPGRGLLIHRKVFNTIGLFEEKWLPHYLADYDFTQQARKNGFKIFCNYNALLYTYPSEGGDHKLRVKKSIRSYFEHLFGIRGGGNLKNFTIYTFRNCPPHDLLMALVSGYARRIGGYWMR